MEDGHHVAKDFPALGTGANNLAHSIAAMSEGRLHVKVYGAGELVPASGVFDAVSGGTAEMGHGSRLLLEGQARGDPIFLGRPLWAKRGRDQRLAALWRRPEPVGRTLRSVQPPGLSRRQHGCADGRLVQQGNQRPRRLLRFGHADAGVWAARSCAALKSRSKPCPVARSSKLSRPGAIDATEWVGPYNDLAFGLHQAAKYYYWPGWHEPGTALECMVNKQALEALPSDLQAVVAYACQAANDDMLSEFTARNSHALKTLVDEHGVQLRRFPDELLAQIGKVAAEVVAEIAGQDPFSSRVYSSFDAFRKNSIAYTRISEEAYAQARALTFG